LAEDHELAGLVDEVNAGDLADLGVVFKTEFPKWEPLKNKSGKSVLFFEPETRPSTHQLSPPIHHNFTTKKPRSTTRFLPKPPAKAQFQHLKKLPQKASSLRVGFSLLRDDEGG
jgi:hypothetical protein